MTSYCTAAACEDELPEIAGVPSVRLLEAAGFRPDVSSGFYAFTVACPCCGESLGVDGDRIYCQPSCSLHRARLVDALSYKLGCKHTALRRELESRAPWLRKRPKWRELITAYLRGAGNLHWLNLAAKGFLSPDDNINISRLRSWTEKNEIHKMLEDGTSVLLDAKTASKLASMATGMPQTSKEKFALFHWIDNATPVSVTLAGIDANPRRIDFRPFAVASTGLHLNTDGRRVLWEDISCLDLNGGSTRHDVWISGGGVDGPTCPTVVIDRGTRDDWLGWGKLFGGCRDCLIRKDGQDEPLDSWLMRLLVKLTENDQWPVSATTAVECLCAPGNGVTRILGELQARDRVHASRELRGRMLTATVWSDDKYQLKRTAAGMLLHDRRQGTDREICNFLIDAECSVVFPETTEFIHEMVVEVQGSKFNAEINSGDLHTVSKFQDSLRISAAKSGCETLPMVTDHALCSKFLLPWLRKTVAGAKQVLGRAMLGWNPERTVFQSATWRLTDDDWHEAEVRLKTSLPALACFDSTAVPTDADILSLPQPAKDMLAIVAALTARYYVRTRVKAVCVQNSSAARGLLKAIFRGFGQLRELEMNAFRGLQALQGIQGHPLLATGFTQTQAEGLPMPVVMLSDTGYAVQSHDEELASKITACSRWMLQSVATWLLATEGKEFSERHAFRFSLGLMDEGARIIQSACSLHAWEITIPEFPALQRMVENLKPEKAFDRFVLLDESRAKIMCGDLVKANDLTMELLLLGIAAKDDEGGLVVQAAPLITLLQDYWGVSPMLVS